MKWPTDSTNVTSKFGLRDAPTSGASTNHRGIDIGVSEGTSVYACEAGKVTTASYSESAGNWVVIDHGNGYVSKYMHNSQLKVSVGDKVEKGQLIALSGNTGVSTGAHLHFQLEYEGSAVDPLAFKYDNGMGDGTEGVGNDTNNSSETTTKYYAKVATWTEKTNTVESNDPDVSGSSQTYYNMTTTNVNYRDMVKGYTMPFDYLWALLVVTEDKDFVLQLADLVYDSEIEITVYDNLEVNTDVVVNTYTKKTKTITTGQVTVNYGWQVIPEYSTSVSGSWEDEEAVDYKVTETEITKTNTLVVSLTKADVWILTYTQEYVHQKPVTSTSKDNTTLENKEYPNSYNALYSEDFYGHAESLLNEQKNVYTQSYPYVGGRIDFVQSKIYNATVNRNKETINTVETTNYTESTGKTVEKTDINAKEENFVKILAKPKCKTARTNIQDISSWLFEILEENQSTADMVDLTKYLLYKCFNKNYGVKKYDFSEYEYTDFSDYSDYSGSGSSIATGGAGTIGVYTATNGRTYNLYLQGSGAPWANEDYGDSHSMALAGCGPTAGAIIASSYNADITPSTFRETVVDLYGLGNHSSPTWIGQAFNKLLPGVKTSVGSTFDENKIKECLKNSGQVWLIVNKRYTSDSHCIALIDYKENSQGQGMVYVAHGTAKSRPYGWDTLNTVKSCYKPSGVLYIGGK